MNALIPTIFLISLFATTAAFSQILLNDVTIIGAPFSTNSETNQLGDPNPTADGRISQMRFSEDGQHLYLSAETIRRFDMDQETMSLPLFPDKQNWNRSPLLSPDRTKLIHFGQGHLVLTDLDNFTKNLQLPIPDKQRVSCYDLAANNTRIALGLEGKLVVLDVGKTEAVFERDQGIADILEIALSPDATKVVAMSRSSYKGSVETAGPIWLYNISGQEPPIQLKGNGSRSTSTLKFSPDASTIIGQTDSPWTLTAWDSQSGNVLWSLRNDFQTAEFSPNGQWIAAGKYGSLLILSPDSGKTLHEIPFPGGDRIVYSTAFSPDSTLLAIGLEDQLRFWNTDNWTERNPSKAHASPITEFKFTKDGDKLLTCDNSGKIIYWDFNKREPIWETQMSRWSRNVRTVKFNEEHKLIVLETDRYRPQDSSCHLLHLDTGKLIRSMPAEFTGSRNSLLTKDGKFLYIGSSTSIRKLETATGKLVREIPITIPSANLPSTPWFAGLEFPMHREDAIWWTDESTRSILFSLKDGSQLQLEERFAQRQADINDPMISLSNLEIFPAHQLPWPDFSNESLSSDQALDGKFKKRQTFPFGRLFLFKYRDIIYLFDGVTHSVIHSYPYPGKAGPAGFSPDGNYVVIGGSAGISLYRHAISSLTHYELSLEDLWIMMGNGNAKKAWDAAWELASREGSRNFLMSKLMTAQKPLPEQLSVLRTMLDDVDPTVHKTAVRALNDLGIDLSDKDKEPRRIWAKFKPQNRWLDVAQGMRSDLLSEDPFHRSESSRPTPLKPLAARARSSRALVLLAKEGHYEAMEFIEELSKGDPAHPQTREAQAALFRAQR